MIDTFEAVFVAILFILPGAMYEWAFERQVGQWNAKTADRLLRFLGVSALLHIAALPASFLVWTSYVRAGALARADDIPWALWPILLAMLAAPAFIGARVGRATREGLRWPQWVTGAGAPPRAWDEVFRGDPRLLVRAQLKSGAWVAGVFGKSTDGKRSYASGYPEDGDLYLSTRVEITNTGHWDLDENGEVRQIDRTGVLIRWEDVDVLDCYRVEGDGDG